MRALLLLLLLAPVAMAARGPADTGGPCCGGEVPPGEVNRTTCTVCIEYELRGVTYEVCDSRTCLPGAVCRVEAVFVFADGHMGIRASCGAIAAAAERFI